MALLEKINSVEDLKRLDVKQLPILAQEIREFLTSVVSNNGGHLASNLGVVELTIALHYVYNSPEDKIVFDVGHQSYVHKLLTGRRGEFSSLRTEGGISGFPKREESAHDVFDTGHSGTAVSAALGLARARDLKGESGDVIAVVGDGALGGGMVFEALNDAGGGNHKMLIIINDNKMSISKPVGGLSRHLSKLRLSKNYVRFKYGLKTCVGAIPLIGKPMARGLEHSRDFFRFMVVKNKMFDQLGLKYIGPIDGHDIKTIISYLERAKNTKGSVVLHILTSKGKGNSQAESDPTAYHGIAGELVETHSFSHTAGSALCEIAKSDSRITVFSAAMPVGTGMNTFQEMYPTRFFDVGIAEEHAVTCAAGMASVGLKPYVAIYSTFLQRAFDQILHDVCLQNLPVTFLIDRAGIVGEDGSTHQGIYDLSYLSLMPNLTIAAPKDAAELAKLIEFSRDFNAPLAIRYPKSELCELPAGNQAIEAGRWEVVQEGDNKIAILALGNGMQCLAREFVHCRVVNPLFVKPLDTAMLDALAADGFKIIVLEENIPSGGLLSSIAEYFATSGNPQRLYSLPLPEIIKHGTIASTKQRIGLTPDMLADLIAKIEN